MRIPRQTDPQFKLRLTPEIDAAIEAAIASNGRKKNGEILARLEQSLLLPEVSFPPDLLHRIRAGSAESMRRAKKMIAEEVVRIYEDYFPKPPPARLHLSPLDMYEVGRRMAEKAPEEDRPKILQEIIDFVRKETNNPNWSPTDEGQTLSPHWREQDK